MLAWIKENVALFSITATLVICVSTAAVNRYQLAGLVAAQPAIQQHIVDSTRHLDPQRDPESTKQMREEIERLRQQVERLERRQIWIVSRVRTGSTTSRRMLLDPPN